MIKLQYCSMKNLLIFAVILIFISGCTLTENTPSDAFICSEPYIQVGSTCCLDQNDDKICDNDQDNTGLEDIEEIELKECYTTNSKEDLPLFVLPFCETLNECKDSVKEWLILRMDVGDSVGGGIDIVGCRPSIFKEILDSNGKYVSCDTNENCFREVFPTNEDTVKSERDMLRTKIRCNEQFFCEGVASIRYFLETQRQITQTTRDLWN